MFKINEKESTKDIFEKWAAGGIIEISMDQGHRPFHE